MRGRLKKRNARYTNFFIKKFTNGWRSMLLLVNEKIILMMRLDKNQLEVDYINNL